MKSPAFRAASTGGRSYVPTMSQHDRWLFRRNIADEVESGMRPTVVAERWGVRIENVYRILREFGVKVPKSHPHPDW